MEDNFNTRDVVIIEPTYPHSMMMHINKLIQVWCANEKRKPNEV